MPTNKALGQHWLKDRAILELIADEIDLTPETTVLEIGPGLGTLTSVLLSQAKEVIAVEFDAALAAKLPGQFPGKNLTVYQDDILSFDLKKITGEYSVVANVPYYITSKIVTKLLTSTAPPQQIALLVQKEVAERMAAPAGEMSMLSVSAQAYADVRLGCIVTKEWFHPAPKVDSQVVVLHPREVPLLEEAALKIAKHCFLQRRKMLHKSLSSLPAMTEEIVTNILLQAGVDKKVRPQDVTLKNWSDIAAAIYATGRRDISQ